MVRVEKSASIKAPVGKVFDYMADPNSNLDFIPGMMDIKNIHETENHIGTHFLWTYKMAGLRFEGETTVLEWVKNKRVVTQSKGGINSKWFFTYESIDNGTALSLVVEYDVPIPVIGKIAEAVIRKQNEREAELALSNIKARMEL
ncbi:MAG: SRPBCC family protein [Spirochaetes bacterium]|nr:SRPBCC family protein [Spirochaetota bacterium]